MGGFSPIHIIIVLLLIVLLFGAGKVSNLMGDVAKGIKSFKKGMAEDDEKPAEPAKPEPKVIEHKAEVGARPAKTPARAKATRSRKSG